MRIDLPAFASSAAAAHSPRLFFALLPIVVLALAFDVYCLVDVIRAPSVRHLPKAVWAIIIVLVSAPWGGLLYLFLGRDRGRGASVPR
jgi:ABC-2 type transport system ATP-binding protein